MTNIDILAIGDITTDAFIKIHDADIHCTVEEKDCKLCFNFGDKIPYDSLDITVAVGNSANAAVSASRLGLNSSILAYVGNDQNGKECIAELKKNGVDTTHVRTEDDKKTNYHFVLWYKVDRTILVKHEDFSYNLGEINPPKWIYLSSVGQSSILFHNQIAEFIEKNPETKLAFQPGTFQIKLGAETLSNIYKNTEIFFCNVEEAQTILHSESRDLPTILRGIEKLGPKITIITDGIEGAYAYDGVNTWFMPVYPKDPYERTGAGDAFASTVVSCLVMGKTLEEALTWGPVNSMSVVSFVGAQKGLLTQEKIKEYLEKAPENYKLKKI